MWGRGRGRGHIQICMHQACTVHGEGLRLAHYVNDIGGHEVDVGGRGPYLNISTN